MEYTTLGSTGMEVSRICLGGMRFGSNDLHGWTLDEEDSRELIERAIDLGINFFDTANAYSNGKSEEIIRSVLSDYDRDEHVVATKGYFPTNLMSDEEEPHPTGTGKTATSQFLCDRLEHESADVQTAYVDCWANSNRTAVLHRVLDEVDQSPPGLHRRTPTDEAAQTLKRDLDMPLVIDEADQIADQVLLHELYEHPLVTMLLIANDDQEFFAPLEQRVNSRLITIPRVHFQKYHDHELVEILRDRADVALEPESVGREQLNTIANAAESATRNGNETILDDTISENIEIARQEVRRKTISTFNPHQRILLEELINHSEMGMAELYPRYEERAENPFVKRTVRNHLNKMAHYNLVVIEGNSKSRTYQPAEEVEPGIVV